MVMTGGGNVVCIYEFLEYIAKPIEWPNKNFHKRVRYIVEPAMHHSTQSQTDASKEY